MGNVTGTTRKRVLSAGALALGAGGAVAATVAPAAPAGAHESALRLGDATAEVSPGHSRIKVCNLETDWLYAWPEWLTPGGFHLEGAYVFYGDCHSETEISIEQYRLCLGTLNQTDHTCTGWKRA